ncbi:hypothetical protein FISHEDRAFT_71435 [Fistulina hepatica ATCC 64428]|nr:hypothetical protein FISHEDRAFT_71435 [Fistulina hepatica ATCC 64428]
MSETVTPEFPVPAVEEEQRVNVGTVEDWRHVKQGIIALFQETLEEELSNSQLSEKEKIDALVDVREYSRRVFTALAPNLRVNGHNFEEVDEAHLDEDPYDEALDRRISAMGATRLQWHKRLAETRRQKPQDIRDSLITLFNETRPQSFESDEETLPEADEPDVFSSPSLNPIHDTFDYTAALSQELTQTVPDQYERSIRVRAVEAEIKKLGPAL